MKHPSFIYSLHPLLCDFYYGIDKCLGTYGRWVGQTMRVHQDSWQRMNIRIYEWSLFVHVVVKGYLTMCTHISKPMFTGHYQCLLRV